MHTIAFWLASILSMFALFSPLFTSAATCPNLYRNLSFGSRGQDVIDLQTLLIIQGDLLAGNLTGYFGRLTEAAVQKFQVKHGLVSSGSPSTTGYGAVGPRTRTKIAGVCGESRETPPNPSSTNFSAYPLTGSAPLTVNFAYSGTNPDLYVIEYGDGSFGTMKLIHPPCAPLAKCSPSLLSSHVYASAGTYTAKLYNYNPNLVDCRATCPPPIGTVTITVTSSSSLRPRVPATKMTLQQLLAMPTNQRLTLKFQEGLRVRMANGQLTGLSSEQSTLFTNVLNSYGISESAIQRLHFRAEAELDAEREQAQQMSGNQLADLNLYYTIQIPQGVQSAYVANALNVLSFVEFSEPSPVPTLPPVI